MMEKIIKKNVGRDGGIISDASNILVLDVSWNASYKVWKQTSSTK